MIKIYYKNIKENELKTLRQFRVGAWMYVEDATEAELQLLAEKFQLEHDLLKDVTDLYEAPRLEVEGNVLYIFTRFAHHDEGHITTVPILFVVSQDFITTIAEYSIPQLEKFTAKKNVYTTQKTKLFLQLFMHVNGLYNQYLNNINRQLRTINIQFESEKISNKDIIQFVSFENVLNDFLSALIPTSSILQNLLSGKYLRLYEEDKDLIEDLLLSNQQLTEMAKSNLRTIVNIREAYSTIMTNNLNQVVKLLTSLTILFTVPTMIASLYGMNVRLPFDQHPYAFFGILAVILTISFMLFLIFTRKRWL